MSFAEAVKTCFRKYATFKGRASRSEFWKFVLFLFLVHVILVVINSVVFGPERTVVMRVIDGELVQTGQRIQYSGGVFANIFGLLTLLPWVTSSWRRMQDTGREGYLPWFAFVAWGFLAVFGFLLLSSGEVAMIPVVFIAGVFVFGLNIYWLTRHSDPEDNKYGPPPFLPEEASV